MSKKAEQQTNGNKKIPKQASRMGKMFSKFGRKATQAMAKGAVKLRVKMAGDGSPIDPNVERALARLKSTKNEIYMLSETVRNLYDARISVATYAVELGNKLSKVNNDYNDDIFNKYLMEMSKIYLILENVWSKHLEKFDELFLKPVIEFRDKAIDGAQKLKLKWKTTKANYDSQLKNIRKAKEKGDIARQAECEGKRDAALKELNIVREALVKSVNIIIQNKNADLLPKMQGYHQEYINYANAQAQTLARNTIDVGGLGQPKPTQQIIAQPQIIQQPIPQPIQEQQIQNPPPMTNQKLPPKPVKQSSNGSNGVPPAFNVPNTYNNNNNYNNNNGPPSYNELSNGNGLPPSYDDIKQSMPPPVPDEVYSDNNGNNPNDDNKEMDDWDKPDYNEDPNTSPEPPNDTLPPAPMYVDKGLKQGGSLLPNLKDEYKESINKPLLALNVSKVNGYGSPIPAVFVHMMQRLEMLSYHEMDGIFDMQTMQSKLNNNNSTGMNADMEREAFEIAINMIKLIQGLPKPMLNKVPESIINKATSKDEMTQVTLLMEEPYSSILTFIWDILARATKNEDDTNMNAAKIAKTFGVMCTMKTKMDNKGNIMPDSNDIMKISKMITFFQRGIQWREDLIVNV